MKKYIRLILLAIALLSCILMFVYRHKYSTLSAMFEVIKGFPYQGSEVKCSDKIFAFKKFIKNSFALKEQISGVPYWTEVTPGIYIYSSYWLSSMVRSLAISKNIPSNFGKIKAKVWFSEQNAAELCDCKYSLVHNASVLYFIDCVPRHSHKIPYGINFEYKNVSSVFTVPVLNQESFIGSNTVCVKPFSPAFGDVYKVLEFVIYHHHIGVNNFIFYDAGIMPIVRKLLLQVAVTNGLYIQLLPWNIPYGFEPNAKNSDSYFVDCLHRVISRNYSDYVFMLDLEHFLILRETFSLKTLKKEFNSLSVAELEVKQFCYEYPNDIIAENLNIPFITLLKTKVDKYGTAVPVIYDITKFRNMMQSPSLNSYASNKSQFSIPTSKAIIHSYGNCSILPNRKLYTEDKTMWQFKDVYFKSHLYLLAKEKRLITN